MCEFLLKSSLSPHHQASSDFGNTRRSPMDSEYIAQAVAEAGKSCPLVKVKVHCPHALSSCTVLTQKGHLEARLGICVMWTVTPCNLGSEEDTASILREDSKDTDRTKLSLSKPWRHTGEAEV